MATVTEQTVDGFISCIDPRCAGYAQHAVQVTRRVVSFSYGDNGATDGVPLSAIERETVAIVQTDEPCEHCGKPTIRAQFERPEYAPMSGQDPLELLAISQQTQIRDAQTKNLETAKETAELRATVAEMRAEMERLSREQNAGLGNAPVKRGPGRPRKEPEEE